MHVTRIHVYGAVPQHGDLLSRGDAVRGPVHSYPLWPGEPLIQANYKFDSCLHQRQSERHGLQLYICGRQQDGVQTTHPFIILILQLGIRSKGGYFPVKITETPRDPGLLATPQRQGRGRGRGSADTSQSPTEFKLPRQVTTGEQPTTRGKGKNKGPACCTIDVRGCSSRLFGVVKPEDEPTLSELLVSRNFLSEHSRQDTEHLSAVLAQKPIWTRGPECSSWAKLTTGPPDLPEEEVVEEGVVFGGRLE